MIIFVKSTPWAKDTSVLDQLTTWGPKKVSSRSRRSRPAASDLINHMRAAATGNRRPRAPTSRKCAHCPPRPPPPPLPAHCSACVNGASSCRSAVASHPSIHPSNLAFAAAAGSRTDSVDSDDDADNDAGDVVVLNGGAIPHTLSRSVTSHDLRETDRGEAPSPGGPHQQHSSGIGDQ